MAFDDAGGQENDKRQDMIFSSYSGPPADEPEEEESPFFKYVDAVAKVAFVNGIVALVLTYFERGIGRSGIEVAIGYFLGVFLGLIILPLVLSSILALPGLFFGRYKLVFKVIFLVLWIGSILFTCIMQYLSRHDPNYWDFLIR